MCFHLYIKINMNYTMCWQVVHAFHAEKTKKLRLLPLQLKKGPVHICVQNPHSFLLHTVRVNHHFKTTAFVMQRPLHCLLRLFKGVSIRDQRHHIMLSRT